MRYFILIFILVGAGQWVIGKYYPDFSVKDWGRQSMGSMQRSEPGERKVLAVAKRVKSGDIVMYSTQGCGVCAWARNWMEKYEISYLECDIEASRQCAGEHQANNGYGVPLFIVGRNGERQVIRGFSPDSLFNALGKLPLEEKELSFWERLFGSTE